MKKITFALIVFVSLTLFSNKLFSQQDSSRILSPSEQVNNQKAHDAATIEDLKDERDNAKDVAKDAQHVEQAASDASKQSKSALKQEKKAQKARKKADAQIEKAEKARNKAEK
jgi:ABC-type nickel/cobalt efflux system permease component RcnA